MLERCEQIDGFYLALCWCLCWCNRLIRNNEFIDWVYSDLYRYFVVVIIVGLILGAKKSFNLERIVKLSAGYEIVVAIVEVFAILSGRYARTSNMMHILFPYAFAVLLFGGKRTLIFWRVGFAIELTRIILSQSRTLLLEAIGFIIVILLLVLEYRQRGVIRHIAELFVLFLVLMLSVQFLIPSLAPFEKYGNRLIQLIDVERTFRLQGASGDSNCTDLFIQSRNCSYAGRNRRWKYLLLPEIMLSAGSEKYLTTSFQVHNIHIGPVSVCFAQALLVNSNIYTSCIYSVVLNA